MLSDLVEVDATDTEVSKVDFAAALTEDAAFLAATGTFFAVAFFNGRSLGETDRFRLPEMTLKSGGSNPKSTEIAKAFGIESQDRPLGAVHFRRFRFCINMVRELS